MKKVIELIISLLLVCQPALSQPKYFIEFVDKKNSPYSISNPQQYLSARAIERRNKQNIPITEQDLPVNPNYLEQIISYSTHVHYTLRWFNGVVATLTDEQLDLVRGFYFVRSIQKIFEPSKTQKQGLRKWESLDNALFQANTQLNYGLSFTQVGMINGHLLHNRGFLGEGKVIAVLDAGFLNVDVHPAFDSLRLKGRILGTKDYVNPKSNIYKEHYHGMMVLSVMGGYVDGQLIGTAPRAHYWLIRTEDASTEQLIEEYNWAAGAEFADSVGADIINSSLGYTVFDIESQNHRYQDLNGGTTPVTKAANMAATKGMVVVVSAGNEGTSPWYYISAPADSPMVLTVGAVDSRKVKANFSSFGPAADGRIKPDVCAMGKGTVLATPNGSVGTSNGTSFSAPIISGMVACLWQAKSELTWQELIALIRSSSSNNSLPNNSIGYGIPDFSFIIQNDEEESVLYFWPNPFTTIAYLKCNLSDTTPVKVTVTAINGQHIISKKINSNSDGTVVLDFMGGLPGGLYFLTVQTPNEQFAVKVVKAR